MIERFFNKAKAKFSGMPSGWELEHTVFYISSDRRRKIRTPIAAQMTLNQKGRLSISLECQISSAIVYPYDSEDTSEQLALEIAVESLDPNEIDKVCKALRKIQRIEQLKFF